jgi:transcription initiation factor IIE alpha subunit
VMPLYVQATLRFNCRLCGNVVELEDGDKQ